MTLEGPEELRKRMADESKGAQKPGEIDYTRPYHSFEFDRTVRGQQYKGTFTSKVPSLGDMIEIGRMKTAYLPQGSAADASAAVLVEAICYLEVVLEKDRPEWWSPLDFLDSAIVMMVYAEVVAYANKFLGRDTESGDTAGTDEEQGEPGGTGSPDESSVDEDVQPAPQRREVVISPRK